MYAEEGRYVHQDVGRAREFYRKGCDGGDQEGCERLEKLN